MSKLSREIVFSSVPLEHGFIARLATLMEINHGLRRVNDANFYRLQISHHMYPAKWVIKQVKSDSRLLLQLFPYPIKLRIQLAELKLPGATTLIRNRRQDCRLNSIVIFKFRKLLLQIFSRAHTSAGQHLKRHVFCLLYTSPSPRDS